MQSQNGGPLRETGAPGHDFQGWCVKTFGRLHAVNVWVTVVLASTMTVAVLVTMVAAVLVAMLAAMAAPMVWSELWASVRTDYPIYAPAFHGGGNHYFLRV